mgnify:FL=1
MAPTDVLAGIIPSVKGFGLGTVDIIAYIIIGFVLIAVMTVAIIWFLLNRKYNKVITIFEKVGGEFVPIGKDRGMEVRYSSAGDSITYLRRRKRYIPNPQIQTGKRQYWFMLERMMS